MNQNKHWIFSRFFFPFSFLHSDNGGANIPFDENSNMNVENFSRLPDTSTSEACRSVERCENCAGSISTPTDAQPNTDDIDHLNGNGIVRMDMSKIIDSTGLPTYDAALKLESCGYVWILIIFFSHFNKIISSDLLKCSSIELGYVFFHCWSFVCITSSNKTQLNTINSID